MGSPQEPQCHYFRTLEDAEIAVDWGKRKISIIGTKVERATDEQAVWIRHIVRASKNNGTVKNIDL